mmetsp:Transcript_17533/g.26078  ORF Transcript_17533/g.26078 Transcript_17533/m.26078 type:complete len:648 (+) Transcript_17533:64-2007(+)
MSLSSKLNELPLTPREFHVAGIIDRDRHFCVDRSRWHEEVANTLIEGKFRLLHSHRQDGKSSCAREISKLLTDNGNFDTIFITLESISKENFWSSIDSLFRRALGFYSSGPLFSDSATFLNYFENSSKTERKKVLIIDEFDNLLNSSLECCTSFLKALRSIATSQSQTVGSKPYSLHAILGIGVYRVLNLVSSSSLSSLSTSSPFNIADAMSPPLPTDEQIVNMIGEYEREYGVTVHTEIVQDIIWRSGRHVGLLSFLCKELHKLHEDRPQPIDVSRWYSHMAGSYLQHELRKSATVATMMNRLSLVHARTYPVILRAREIVASMLSAPDDHELDLTIGSESGDSDPLSYLLSEGVIIDVTRHGTSSCMFRITAPLLTPLLMQDIRYVPRYSFPIGFSFPRLANGSINLETTLLESLQYFSVESLFHPFALLSYGSPCEFAYHFQLCSILHSRGSDGGWRIVGESRNCQAAGTLRRMGILIASNGHRVGIELLAEGAKLESHITEQAVTYKQQQELRELLVVNFCHASAIDETVHPSDGIGVMHIIVDRERHSLTPVVFRDTSFVHFEPIVVLEHSQSSYTPSCGAYLDTAMAQLSLSSGLSPTTTRRPVSALSLSDRLSQLKDALDCGHLSREEYEAKRKEMISEF